MNNIKDLIFNKWSGGITREIFKDQENFNIRISCAEIYPGENLFSDFTGYKRILKILENDVIIKKNNEEKLLLNQDNLFIFNGSDRVKSKNNDLVLDFNVIYKSEYVEVSFEEIVGSYIINNFYKKENILIFSIKDNSKIFINNDNLKLKKYDFLILNYSNIFKLEGNFILVKFKKN